jgi:predicted nucleic acid-binding protein
LPDAIVAATAIENDMMLITADTGFEAIKELKLEKIVPVL